MGAGWRRWKEKVRESMPGTHTDLTSNARNKAMMKTATDFSMQVKKCEKAIRAAHAANAELLSTTKTVMSLPLPQTFEETNAGAGGAAVALHQVGGPNFKADALSRVANESGHKLETEVLAPLTRWQDVHLQLVARFKELENTRLELDSRRRTVAEMSTKVSAMRTRLGTSGGGAKTEAKLDSTIRILSHKEAKLKVTSQNFDQQEALLARDLAALIADGQYLKHYVAAALRLQGGALLGAADAFGELTSGAVAAAPMPAGPSPGTTPTGAMAAAGMGAAGFGAAGAASSSGVPPAAAVSGPGSHRSMSDGGNPYHTGSLSSGAAKAATLGGVPADTRSYTSGSQHGGTTKRYTEPEAGDQYVGTPPKSLDGAPAAGVRYPVAPSAAEQPPSDNPYSSVRYQYA